MTLDPTPPVPPSDIAEPAARSRRGAVAVVAQDGRLLVIRRAMSVVAPGAYCFPGGGIEGDESEEEALVREIREELGVAIQPLRRIWQSTTAWHVELAWWHCELASDCVLVANPAEVESVHWHTPAEMAALAGLLPSNRHFLEALAGGEIVLPL